MKKIKERFLAFYHTTYGMLITVSWLVLIACLIIKLFGGNWFALESKNSKFNDFCIFVDNTQWLKMVLACIIYIVTSLPIICILFKTKTLNIKLHCLYIPLMIIKSFTSWYFIPISFILDFIMLIILPIIFTKKWKYVIIINILIFIFQCITMGLRSLSFNFFGKTFIEQFLIQIDFYLMIWLLYLYTFNTKKVE